MKPVLRFTAGIALNLMLGAACFAQHYTQTNLLSNAAEVAPVTDPEVLVASGGSSTSRWGFSTPYNGAITVSPKHAAVTVTTQTQQFASSINAVTWSVDGVVGGNATVGTISPSGLYTPPATAGTHRVTATNGPSSGSATIAVTDLPPVLTSPTDPPTSAIHL